MSTSFSFPAFDQRSKSLSTLDWSYKLQEGKYALDVVTADSPKVNEKKMSLILPFADGNRRDGVGDLLEVGGIDCSRHRALRFAGCSQFWGRHRFFDAPSTNSAIKCSLMQIHFLSPIANSHSFAFKRNRSSFRVFNSANCSLWSYLSFFARLRLFIGSTTKNSPNNRLTSIKFMSNLRLRKPLVIHLMYLRNLKVFKECPTNVFSGWHCTMSSSILLILRRCSPSKVTKPIIMFVPVQMATLHLRRTLTNKRKQHKAMNKNVIASPIFRKSNDFVVAIYNTLFNNLSWNLSFSKLAPNIPTQRTNSTKTRNLVYPNIIRNIYPTLSFAHKAISFKTTRSTLSNSNVCVNFTLCNKLQRVA